MKTLKLKPGFLVQDWDGDIIPIFYTIFSYMNYGTKEKKFLYCTKNGDFSEPISEWSSDKIFDSLEEAEKHSKIKKKERIKYYENQVKKYLEKLNSCKNENT
jgi:hypothetical protein